MNNLPIYISLLFGLTTLITVGLFFKAANNSVITLVILLSWLLVQSIISYAGFYTITNGTPPRFLLLVGPPLIVIASLFITPWGRHWLDRLNTGTLTLLHIIRIPVEIVLFLLCVNKVVPQLMTFEGRNFDILSGISAPVIFYLGFIKRNLSKMVILLWNFACLGLLVNIVANAVLSAPFPFQRFGFDQPNIAILYFPFAWLPCCVVPLVLLSHLASIRQLLTRAPGKHIN